MTDTAESPEFDALLAYLKRTRGFDFSGYKQASLLRRMTKRLQVLNLESFNEYNDYLEVHPEEFEHLFEVIQINVTAFFRDPSAWDYLREYVLPQVLSKREGGPLRIWSAGCSSGEEAYSLAMLFAEALGRQAFRDRVKIYATDLDNDALAQARAATYTDKQVEAVPPELLSRYFAREQNGHVFDADLRRSVIFGRHDLLQDAPISKVDLLTCRNSLMYFNTDAQARILARFHFALADSGFLFLGKAEMLLTHSQLFSPVELRQRIFRKLSKESWRDRLTVMTLANGDDHGGTSDHGNLYSAAFQAGAGAQLIVDSDHSLVTVNEAARSLFNIVPTDVGRPLDELELSYRPVDIRKLTEQALEQRRPVAARDVEWAAPGREPRYFDVQVSPLVDGGGPPVAVSVAFVDATRVHDLQTQLHRTMQDLETAYEELQSTNEELETTNEELQSTVEELETTNEELQSTNEELETMNEELQSTNEELQTVNEELRIRSEDLTRANSFLESVLSSVRQGVIVLDRDFNVIAWNHRSEDLWGLRTDEVSGQDFFSLDIGLPTDALRDTIQECLAGQTDHVEVVVNATNRRGKSITCKVATTPLVGTVKEQVGVILLVDEQHGPRIH